MPIAGYRPAGSRPAVIAACLSLHTAVEAKQTEKKVKSHSFAMRHILAQLLKWLMLITITIGMCLMNGYAVFKMQTRSSIKDKQVKEKVPSPVSSLVG